MNCNLCGCDGAYLAHKIGRKIISICGDCWYDEMKWRRKIGEQQWTKQN
jgi:hypothetical protein